MTQELHDRAKGLAATARVEGISPTEREWLEAHLQSCPNCAAFAGEMERSGDQLVLFLARRLR